MDMNKSLEDIIDEELKHLDPLEYLIADTLGTLHDARQELLHRGKITNEENDKIKEVIKILNKKFKGGLK